MAEHYNIRRIKGDIAEAICRNHLNEMGLNVEFAGVEHFAKGFANRQREDDADESSESKIHNYIGQLPDILAGSANFGHYFVEVKYRAGVDIDDFIKELLWDYRKIIFKVFDTEIFKNISPAEWESSKFQKNKELKKELHERFYEDLGSRTIPFSKIALPVLFYILVKSETADQKAQKISLHLLHFDRAEGKFLLHEAGTAATEHEDSDFGSFLLAFDEAFIKIVVPVLNDLLSANIAVKPSKVPVNNGLIELGNDSIAAICHRAAKAIKKDSRNGVYFRDLLLSKEVSGWLKSKKLQIDRFVLKAELERAGISNDGKAVVIDGKSVTLQIKDYGRDFDFSMS